MVMFSFPSTDGRHRSLPRCRPSVYRLLEIAVETCRRGPLIVPAGIMAEATHMIEARLGPRVLDVFLADIEDGAFGHDCGDGDLPRVRELIARYSDFPLGYADAAVIACAERHRGGILTYELRHFLAVAAEGTIRIIGAGAE